MPGPGRHRQRARLRVLQPKILVVELRAVDREAARAVAPRDVAALAHEARDDADGTSSRGTRAACSSARRRPARPCTSTGSSPRSSARRRRAASSRSGPPRGRRSSYQNKRLDLLCSRRRTFCWGASMASRWVASMASRGSDALVSAAALLPMAECVCGPATVRYEAVLVLLRRRSGGVRSSVRVRRWRCLTAL